MASYEFKRPKTLSGKPMKKSKQDIAKLLEQWRKDFTVFVPSRETARGGDGVWDGQDTGFLDLVTGNTVIRPRPASC
jgi:hypothetical protein